MAVTIKSLINKRASFKRYLTEFSNYLDSIDSHELSYLSIAEINARLEKLESRFNQFETVNEDLYELDSDNFEKHLLETTDIDNKYFAVK